MLRKWRGKLSFHRHFYYEWANQCKLLFVVRAMMATRNFIHQSEHHTGDHQC